jgi:hypothetical protein
MADGQVMGGGFQAAVTGLIGVSRGKGEVETPSARKAKQSAQRKPKAAKAKVNSNDLTSFSHSQMYSFLTDVDRRLYLVPKTKVAMQRRIGLRIRPVPRMKNLDDQNFVAAGLLLLLVDSDGKTSGPREWRFAPQSNALLCHCQYHTGKATAKSDKKPPGTFLDHHIDERGDIRCYSTFLDPDFRLNPSLIESSHEFLAERTNNRRIPDDPADDPKMRTGTNLPRDDIGKPWNMTHEQTVQLRQWLDKHATAFGNYVYNKFNVLNSQRLPEYGGTVTKVNHHFRYSKDRKFFVTRASGETELSAELVNTYAGGAASCHTTACQWRSD